MLDDPGNDAREVQPAEERGAEAAVDAPHVAAVEARAVGDVGGAEAVHLLAQRVERRGQPPLHARRRREHRLQERRVLRHHRRVQQCCRSPDIICMLFCFIILYHNSIIHITILYYNIMIQNIILSIK